MEFIDKSRYVPRENSVNRKFLTDCLQQDGTFIPNVSSDTSYTNFCDKKYRGPISPVRLTEPWLLLLLEEQNGKCAYCMRRITAQECDVEHVIPRNLKNEADVANYYRYAPQLSNRVVHARLFPTPSSQGAISSTTAFPHNTALANLVVTCKVNNRTGEAYCDANNHRHNSEIIPICLAHTHTLYYAANGTCFVINDTGKIIISDTPAILNLNTNTLRAIRMTWYLASINNLTPPEIAYFAIINAPFKLIETLLKNHGDTESADRIIFSKQISSVPNIMESLMHYVWFYSYYKDIAPNIRLHG